MSFQNHTTSSYLDAHIAAQDRALRFKVSTCVWDRGEDCIPRYTVERNVNYRDVGHTESSGNRVILVVNAP